MDSFRVRLRIWPHQTGAGHEVDQAAAGPREIEEMVRAADISHAVEIGELMARTIKLNPRVWQVPFVSAERVSW